MDQGGYIVAITGASGAIYGKRVLEELLKNKLRVYFTITPPSYPDTQPVTIGPAKPPR
jgi:3-polyprenyl-4-hydroxybenzoate decarboxylase